MFSPRKNLLINAFQVRQRARAAHASFSNTNVRTMIAMLRRNATVWYAPDQMPSGKNGAHVDFLGASVMSSTAPSRLARVTRSSVVPLFFQRMPSDDEYVLRFEPAIAEFPTDDPTFDTTRMMGIIECFARECPSQYFWTHKRIKDPVPHNSQPAPRCQ
jgi:KDO2-lipid IV(A) lauroyltransferase